MTTLKADTKPSQEVTFKEPMQTVVTTITKEQENVEAMKSDQQLEGYEKGEDFSPTHKEESRSQAIFSAKTLYRKTTHEGVNRHHNLPRQRQGKSRVNQPTLDILKS